MSDLLGTHPVQVQSPPIGPLSSSAVRAPSWTAKSAAINPEAPAPSIARSYSDVLIRFLIRFERKVCCIVKQEQSANGQPNGAEQQPIDRKQLAQHSCHE